MMYQDILRGALMVAVSGFVHASTEAALINPDFTDGTTGWTLTQGASVDPKNPYTPVYGNTGYALVLDASVVSGISTIGGYQLVPTNPGDKWTFTGYIYHSVDFPLNLAAGYATMEFIGLGGQTVSTGYLPETRDGLWDRFSISAETPSGVTQVRFGAMLDRSSTTEASGKVFFDHFEVISTPEATSIWLILAIIIPAVLVRGPLLRNKR